MSDEEQRLIGYARTSTSQQNLDIQLKALKRYGVRKENIFVDVKSGMKKDRPGIDELWKTIQPGDALVVWKLDRLGRSSAELHATIAEMKDRDLKLVSITEHIDFSTPQGRFAFSILAAVAQMERDLTVERTKQGLAEKKARGERVSRPPKINKRMWNEALVLIHGDPPMSLYQVGAQILQDDGTPVTRQAWYKHKKKLLNKEPYPFNYNNSETL